MKLAPVIEDDSDLTSLQLSATEGFIISQVDGLTPAGVLCDLLGFDEITLIIALQRLEKLGVIRWARRHTDPKGGRQSNDDTAAQTAIAQKSAENPALIEPCDLSRDERLLILKAERDLDLTHWETLGLGGDAQPADIKRAYFVASKLFHPDRYFGRDLGSYKERLERIFRGLKVAYDTLANPQRNREYRLAHPPAAKGSQRAAAFAAGDAAIATEASGRATPAPPGETAAQKEARLERRRQQILKERRSKRLNKHVAHVVKAVGAKMKKAEDVYNMGLMQLNGGNVFAAVASFKLAMTYDETNTQYRVAFEEANGGALVERARQVAEQAQVAVGAGKAGEAGRLYSRAFEMAPHKAEYAVRAAQQLLAAGTADDAKILAIQAVEVSPNRASAHAVLATVLEDGGDLRAALDAYEKAQTLDPSDSHVTKSIKRLEGKLR